MVIPWIKLENVTFECGKFSWQLRSWLSNVSATSGLRADRSEHSTSVWRRPIRSHPMPCGQNYQCRFLVMLHWTSDDQPFRRHWWLVSYMTWRCIPSFQSNCNERELFEEEWNPECGALAIIIIWCIFNEVARVLLKIKFFICVISASDRTVCCVVSALLSGAGGLEFD